MQLPYPVEATSAWRRQKLVGCILSVDTIEETNSAYRKFVTPAFYLLFTKRNRPSFPVLIFQDPPGCFPRAGMFYFFGVENLVNIFVQHKTLYNLKFCQDIHVHPVEFAGVLKIHYL